MTSKLVDVKVTDGYGVTFVIEHLPTDSYSRSVRIAARKAYRKNFHLMLAAGHRPGTPVFEGPWNFDLEAPEGKCRTSIDFTIGRTFS